MMAPNNITNTNRDVDWLASLARQSALAENSPKQRGSSSNSKSAVSDHKRSNEGNDGSALTKIQRIERREQKRSQREDRKRLAVVARQQRLLKKRRVITAGGEKGIPASVQSVQRKLPLRAETNVKRNMTTKSKLALARLSTALGSTVLIHAQTSSATTISITIPRQSKRKLHDDTTSQSRQIVNGVLAEPKGKATKSSTLRPESKELQPRVRDYNGQGLVRPSVYIPFNDPSFIPKVEMEFDEHIPGFFGKAKQKAAKKQTDQNMLWKRCLREKMAQDGIACSGSTKRRKVKTGAGVDKRVEGLMRRGVV